MIRNNTFMFLLLALPSCILAFQSNGARSRASSLNMAPKFDKATQRWSPTSPEEESGAGYDKLGSLLRHGPLPFVNRLFNEDEYEQGVLKFMATDKCTRMEAQGNMDAYLANPNDWAYNRFQEEEKGFKVDYVTLKKKDIALTSVWSAVVLALIGRATYSYLEDEYFWAFITDARP